MPAGQLSQKGHSFARLSFARLSFARLSFVRLSFVRLPFVRLACAAIVGGALSHAVEAAASKPDAAAAIKQTIEARFPGTHVLDVQPSVLPGLYEIFMGDQIVYSDASADYLLMGPLVDTQTRQNLTEARMNEHGRINFGALPFDRAIKVVKGNGSRHFAVFSDPDCPFCQQLEKSLLSVTDVTMYVFLFPIATLHPQAPAKARAIWCAPNRSQAWAQWMHEKKLPPAGSCGGDPINELQKLGDQLRVNSTPTLFFANGRRKAGAIPATEIEQQLSAASGSKSAAAPSTSR